MNFLRILEHCIFLIMIVKFAFGLHIVAENRTDEMPNDVNILKGIIKRLENENSELKDDNSYLNEIVLGEIPKPHRRTVFEKMKYIDSLTEEEFLALRPNVSVGEIRYMYFSNIVKQGELPKYPHPFYVVQKSGTHLLSGIPISKQRNAMHSYNNLEIKIKNSPYKRYLLVDTIIQIDERRDCTGDNPLTFETSAMKIAADFMIGEHYNFLNRQA